jgi:hypothetical protein
LLLIQLFTHMGFRSTCAEQGEPAILESRAGV